MAQADYASAQVERRRGNAKVVEEVSSMRDPILEVDIQDYNNGDDLLGRDASARAYIKKLIEVDVPKCPEKIIFSDLFNTASKVGLDFMIKAAPIWKPLEKLKFAKYTIPQKIANLTWRHRLDSSSDFNRL